MASTNLAEDPAHGLFAEHDDDVDPSGRIGDLHVMSPVL